MSESSDEKSTEETKMQEMLAEWDDDEEKNTFEDDEDSDDEEAKAKKVALLAADESSSEEEESESEEEESEEESEEEETDSEEEEETDEEEEEDEEIESDFEEVSVDDSTPKAAEKKTAADAKSVASSDDDSVVEDDDEPIVDTLKKKSKKKKKKKKTRKLTETTDDDDDEDKAMKALLAGWDADNGTEEKSDDEDEDDDEDDSEASEREVVLTDNVIDHIVLAAPNLEKAMKDFQKQSGIEPVIAGTIKGLGIRCARASFNDSSYIEIIAPDPKSPGPIGELLKAKKIKEMVPFHYAIRSSRAEELKDEVTKFGYRPDHITMFGAKQDGTPRKWEMLYLYGHRLGGLCPFFINWNNSDHPCSTLPVVGKLKKFTIRAPEEDKVHELFQHCDIDGINVEVGKPKFSFQFSSPEGTVKFSSSKAVGFKFPGFEDDDDSDPGEADIEDMVEFENPAAPELLTVGDYEE